MWWPHWTSLPDIMVERRDRDLLAAVRRFSELAGSWHQTERTATCGAGELAAEALFLHATNFDLWHHEDAARRPGAGNDEVADRKRMIDQHNDRRTRCIEDIDTMLLELCGDPAARSHTDTPGAIVDRLSVLALRIAHTSADPTDPRMTVLREQHDDLYGGLVELLADLQAGRVRFTVYRQFKSAAQRSHCSLFETGQPVSVGKMAGS